MVVVRHLTGVASFVLEDVKSGRSELTHSPILSPMDISK